MRAHEAIQYLPFRKLDPCIEVDCASGYCGNKVQLARAIAYPALFTDGSVKMAFWCSEGCLTTVMCGGRC